MNDIFKEINFWIVFLFLEEDIKYVEFDLQLEKLKQIFPYTKHVESDSYEECVIEMEFNCGKTYSIILEYKLRYSIELTTSDYRWTDTDNRLFLKNKTNNQRFLMGWNDMAQWHPLCIKPDEFVLLLNYWQKQDSKWANTVYPKLLLRSYVGFSNAIEVEQFKEELQKDYEKLGVEIPKDIKSKFLHVQFYEEEDYKWLENAKLGWVYESTKYNCYSIRNECHSTSDDEVFPFKEYRDMIDTLIKSKI